MNCSMVCSFSIAVLLHSCVFYTKSAEKKAPPRASEHFDHHGRSAPKAIETRRAMSSRLGHAWRGLQQAQAEHLLAEIALIEGTIHNRLIHPLQLCQGKSSRQKAIDNVGIFQLPTQSLQRVCQHLGMVIRQGRRRG